MSARRAISTAAGAVLLAALSSVTSAQPALQQRQTQADDYTRYELLAPGSRQFRILYDVTATTPGARYYFNVIRKGSEASDESVIDLATGEALKFEVVGGEEAQRTGHPDADADTEYIKVHLRHRVPAGGEARIRIDKTYRDAQSYYTEGDLIVFDRSLGIERNAVVLPAGYELVACNMPSQVWTESDGRVAIGFMNTNPDAVSLVVKARPLKAASSAGNGGSTPPARSPAASDAAPAGQQAEASPAAGPDLARSAEASIPERAFQDREIVYFLQDPSTQAFDLYHDYTESRPGVDHYLNVVRAGSRVSTPSALNLDTGESLNTEIVTAAAARKAGYDVGAVPDDTQVVVVRFPGVPRGGSSRIRISETYTDPGRYGVVGGELVWHREFGRPRNALVLPAGWRLTASAIPAVVSETDDGRVRLDLDNPRPDGIDVLVRARRR